MSHNARINIFMRKYINMHTMRNLLDNYSILWLIYFTYLKKSRYKVNIRPKYKVYISKQRMI